MQNVQTKSILPGTKKDKEFNKNLHLTWSVYLLPFFLLNCVSLKKSYASSVCTDAALYKAMCLHLMMTYNNQAVRLIFLSTPQHVYCVRTYFYRYSVYHPPNKIIIAS